MHDDPILIREPIPLQPLPQEEEDYEDDESL